MSGFKLTVCKECGQQILLVRTQSGAKLPVNKEKAGYIVGGKDQIITPAGEIIAATITNETNRTGYTMHWLTCNKRNRRSKHAAPLKPKPPQPEEESLF